MRRDAANAIRRIGRQSHQRICDQCSKVAHRRIRFIRKNQDQLRASSYKHIMIPPHDAVRGVALGKRVIFPATFAGGQRKMSEMYQSAMAIVRSFGNPRRFVAFTRNPSWQEVAGVLAPNQTAATRPDFTARVFRLTLNAPMKDISDVGAIAKLSRGCT